MMASLQLQRFRHEVRNDIRRHLSTYLVVVFCFLLGLTAGLFAAGGLQNTQLSAYQTYLQGFFISAAGTQLNFLVILLQSLLGNLLLFALIMAAGMLPILLPISALALIIKGFFLGFSLSALIGMLGFAGVLVALVCIVLPALVLAPCYIKVAVLSFRTCAQSIRFRMRCRYASYLREMSLWFVIALVGVLIEALVAPAWLKLCSQLFN